MPLSEEFEVRVVGFELQLYHLPFCAIGQVVQPLGSAVSPSVEWREIITTTSLGLLVVNK